MNSNVKSSTTAGLLGIFLGAFGGHNWYLGEKQKGIAHCCMMGAGILIEILSGAVLPNVLSWRALLTWATILGILSGIAGLVMSASAIWGAIEGIMILSAGDAGLAQKGYKVATPVAPMQPGYGPMPNQGYGQPMQQPMQPNYGPMPQQPMQQPMQPQQPVQPMPQQPAQPVQPIQPAEPTVPEQPQQPTGM